MDNWMTKFPVHFVSAAGVVFKEDKVLLIRSERRGWEFPGGIVEHGEAVLDALKREIFEESGINRQHSIIYLEKDPSLIRFKDTYGNFHALNLSKNCPLQLALIYYLIKSGNVNYLLELIKGNKNCLNLLYNGLLNFNDIRPIKDILNPGATIRVEYTSQIVGAL